MSKSNSIKKLSIKKLSPPGNTIQNDNTPTKSISLSNPHKISLQTDQPGIIEVYEDNFIEEGWEGSVFLSNSKLNCHV